MHTRSMTFLQVGPRPTFLPVYTSAAWQWLGCLASVPWPILPPPDTGNVRVFVTQYAVDGRIDTQT
jgi:hypothetical protein